MAAFFLAGAEGSSFCFAKSAVLRPAQPCSDQDSPPDCPALSGFDPFYLCYNKTDAVGVCLLWQGQKGSNPRHAVLETAALPAELYPCVWLAVFPNYCVARIGRFSYVRKVRAFTVLTVRLVFRKNFCAIQ